MGLLKKDFFDKSVISLLATNTIPLFGVLFLDWDAFFIVLLYWSENLAIGFFNILKVVHIPVSKTDVRIKYLIIPFFAIHYGIFTAGHGFFVFFLFYFKSGRRFWEETDWMLGMIIAVLALFISHGISFFYNYLHKREFASANFFKLMISPYRRVVVMHIAIIAGSFLIISIKSSSQAALLVVLVVLKTFLDLTLHLRSHKKAQTNIRK